LLKPDFTRFIGLLARRWSLMPTVVGALGWLLILAAAILVANYGRSDQGVAGLTSDSEVLEPEPVFPLRVSDNRRYLTDRNGIPFLIQGDTPWSLMVALTSAQVEQYLSARHKQGFNALWVGLIDHHFPGAENSYGAPFNRYGQMPFLTPGDFARPNEAYFAHADRVLRRAGELGFVVFLTPCYLGYPGTEEGWYREVKKCTVENCRDYGRYLGKRYAQYKNIIWVAGGDRAPGEVRPQVLALVEGIREFDPESLWTVHTARGDAAADEYGDESWLSLNSTYTGKDLPGDCLRDYLRLPVRPSFLFEAYYENEKATATETRRQAWFAILSGACGQFFGNDPIWYFGAGWPSALSSPGAVSEVYLRRCLLSRRWEQLVPETGKRFLVDGLGNETNRKAAAMTRDSATALVYLPMGGQVAIDLSAFKGPEVRSWWFNPRDGSSGAAGVYAAAGNRTFSAPNPQDWVLVLDTVTHDVPFPGARNVFAATSNQ
jgi:hypothetical protein